MTSDEKTLLPSLLNYIESDLFTFENLSSSITLANEDDVGTLKQWDAVIEYLPLKFFKMIETYPFMYTIEKFDHKYSMNPKMCAYDRYESTNMWRPLMILNKCPSILQFDFKFIRYYNIAQFSKVLSVLISRVQNHEV